MKKPYRVTMCPHCGRFFTAGTYPSIPSHFMPVAGEFDEICPGSYDTGRNPWHDRRLLGNGQEPPPVEAADKYASRTGASK